MTLRVEVTVEATGDADLSEQKIEEIKIALRELDLDDNVIEAKSSVMRRERKRVFDLVQEKLAENIITG